MKLESLKRGTARMLRHVACRVALPVVRRRTLSTAIGLNEDQTALRELAAKFCAAEITPAAAHHDTTGEYPSKILEKLHQVGGGSFGCL